ncbi:MbtH family NRPS accessory protein [Streptomyces sp. NPDC052016]|uniref:MbtH family NRPS accessory protein n=1 Tax=Streptomyces sp. NPDC052016 TaxID=3365680 RepID=UPI0037D779A4
MSYEAGPFDPGPDGKDTHLVLENAQGQQSLWPTWRAVPPGWNTRFGPAPHEACARQVARDAAGGTPVEPLGPPPG